MCASESTMFTIPVFEENSVTGYEVPELTENTGSSEKITF